MTLPLPTAARAILALVLLTWAPAATAQPADLVIRNARVFDPVTLEVSAGRSVLIHNGVITAVLPDADVVATGAERVVNAENRLLTPGFIDVHAHTGTVLGDSMSAGGGEIVRLHADADSIARYRRALAAAYLPHGVTALRELGADDSQWAVYGELVKPARCMPAYYSAGGALITRDPESEPYAGHRALRDSVEAAAVVREYHAQGIRHIKLYWRLNGPELRAAMRTADSLGMNVTAHMDRSFGSVSIQDALDAGVRNIEHVYTLAPEIMTIEEIRGAWSSARALLAPSTDALFHMGIFEHFRLLPADDARMERIVGRFAEEGVSLTPTLHLFAQRAGVAYFVSEPGAAFENSSGWSPAQRAQAQEGYARMAELAVRMHRTGVRLATGSDTSEPGRAILSEMLLLHAAGIPMPEVLRIGTAGSADAAGLSARHGRIAAGYSADLVLFNDDPLQSPEALTGPKRVWRAGIEWATCAGDAK